MCMYVCMYTVFCFHHGTDIQDEKINQVYHYIISITSIINLAHVKFLHVQ